MIGHFSPRCWLLAAGLLLAPLSRQALGQDANAGAAVGVEDEKAQQTFREGIAAFDRRDFEAARVAFLQTFALKPTAPVVRRNLGLAEIYSGHYLEGARRLGRVIHTTDEGTALDRARMLESLKKAEAHLERVTVEVNTDGAKIVIGDVDLGVSPLPFAWYLEPGAYDVRVSKPGYAEFTETRLARAGSAQHLRINLRPLAHAEAAPPPAPPAPTPESMPALERERGGVNPWIVAAGSALTAGGLATGITLRVFAADNEDKARGLQALIGPNGCSGRATPECGELFDTFSARDRQVRWAAVSFALGAAAGVSTVVYALLAGAGGGQPRAGGASDIGVSLHGGAPHVTLSGSF